MDALASKLPRQNVPDFREDRSGIEPCRGVSLQGKMCLTGGGYIPENDDWFDVLTEPARNQDHPSPAARRAGRDPMTIPVEILTASGHPRRPCAAVVSAYCKGLSFEKDKRPPAKSYKQLRSVICMGCAECAAEVRRCTNINCPIWPYRMGRNPHNPRRGVNPFAMEGSCSRQKERGPHLPGSTALKSHSNLDEPGLGASIRDGNGRAPVHYGGGGHD